MPFEERTTCPACGGAGGGPFGRAGSAWDDEGYVCPRCKGEGTIVVGEAISQRPGLVKAGLTAADAAAATKRKATG